MQLLHRCGACRTLAGCCRATTARYSHQSDSEYIVQKCETDMNDKTVLIVEDNHDNRAIFAAILNHFGYDVIEAADGEDGVQLARSEHPDLILMDISLPRMDGLQATALLKSEAGTADIPIIAVTAHAMREDEERVRNAGCDGYLAKPVEPMRVIQEVGRFLNGATGVGPERRPVV
jgi:two-component system, cell cycle response regulator DivK